MMGMEDGRCKKMDDVGWKMDEGYLSTLPVPSYIIP